MNLFDEYGIKEVANATLFSIHRKTDGSDQYYYMPALHLDTLKISTPEKSGETMWAAGGQDNGRLISFDASKNIDIHLEDALCTPASLNLCWGGILSSDWKDAKVDFKTGICRCDDKITRLTRMDKTLYTSNNQATIISMLPQTIKDNSGLSFRSSVIDEIEAKGYGVAANNSYQWKMHIRSAIKSIFVVPDKCFDIRGKSYLLDMNKTPVAVTLPTYSNLKNAVIYKMRHFIDKTQIKAEKIQNSLLNQLVDDTNNYTSTAEKSSKDYYGTLNKMPSKRVDACAGDYLAIIIDNKDEYHALIGTDETDYISWNYPVIDINVNQFKGLDMWLKFENLNELVYFLITKYKENIKKVKGGTLWCYLNPKTLSPYADDYWFTMGEPYIKNSFNLTSIEKPISGRRITVYGDEWPGVYLFMGETYIRDRESGEDKHLQILIPRCKVRSDHTLTLESDSEPTTFNIDLEVARPRNGIIMELNIYETAQKLLQGENGCYYPVDGSSQVMSE